MTERLYYRDAYLRTFRANLIEIAGDGTVAYLDQTAFYPTSGGQPFDMGLIAGVRVEEVVDEGERIAHRLAAPVEAGIVDCAIDWPRRFDHMQQHTGQHLLSAIFREQFGLHTLSFHLGTESATIDLEADAVEPAIIREAERRANEIVCENRSVAVRFEQAAEAQGLRKPSERVGTLRIVSIEGLDRSACGGTHVRLTGEIGPILVRKLEKVRQAMRVEFLCGARAVGRARADCDVLVKVAQLFSAPLDDTPRPVAAQLETARAVDKARRKLESELATYQGKELYESAEADTDGVRRHVRRLTCGSMEALRALAQSFTAHPNAIFVATSVDPPAILYAVSADIGIDAGKALKACVAEAGGRGGGNSRLAQGTLPDPIGLADLAERLASAPDK